MSSAPPSSSPCDDGKGEGSGSATTTTTTVNDLAELQTELTSLNRVSHRLATTSNDGSAFEKVVSLLLPRLLQRIGKNDENSKKNKNTQCTSTSSVRYSGSSNNKRKEPSFTSTAPIGTDAAFATTTIDEQQQQQQIDDMHTAIHAKYIEMIAHIRKRARDDRSCSLPCDAILNLLQATTTTTTTSTTNGRTCKNNESEVEEGTIVTAGIIGRSNPFTVNLSLAFLTLGINRCSSLECARLLPRMLLFWGSIYEEEGDDENQEGLTTNKKTPQTTNNARCASSRGNASMIGAGYMLDPSRRLRHDQTCHLILRCLESIASHNPDENAASTMMMTTTRAIHTSQSSSMSTTSSSSSSNNKSLSPESASVFVSMTSLLQDTKQILIAHPRIASAMFDLIVDVVLYTPIPSTSSLIPNGLSMVGYQRLIGGAASETSSALMGCKNWREEYNASSSTSFSTTSTSSGRSSRGGGAGAGGSGGVGNSRGGGGGGGSNLKQLKLKLLDLIAPCRKYALFLPEKEKKKKKEKEEMAASTSVVTVTAAATEVVAAGWDNMNAESSGSGIDYTYSMAISRTVALMVLLTGDSDPDVKSRAESFLRAHMDSYRGREVQRLTTTRHTADARSDLPAETIVHDALLGNSVALAQSILTLCLGGATSLNIEKTLSSQYKSAISTGILKSRLGLTFCADVSNAQEQKVLLSCSRMKMSEVSATTALKFVAKMLDENPRLFHVGMDMEKEESDVAAVSIGTLVLAVMSDMHRPGSSASSALESAASLLNSLCVRISLFYDARAQSKIAVPESLERIRLLLARAMKLVCAILAPTSSGESTSLSSAGTKVSNTQIDIRDRCYGVICTLARSLFALDDRHALFDCGNSNPIAANYTPPFSLRSISTATLLFGCTSNEENMLQPRATSALDALLGAKVRAIKSVAGQKREEPEEGLDAAANPWADTSEHVDYKTDSNVVESSHSSDGLARSLLPLLWNAVRHNQPKSSRLAAARWSSDLLLCLDSTSAFHILCFLSGDDDVTVAAIAKQALRVDKSLGEDNVISSESNSSKSGIGEAGFIRPAFSALMDAIAGFQSTRPYSTFNVRAKAATLRFLLQSLFSEENLYDNYDCVALQKFVSEILDTFEFYIDRSLSRDEIDLLDECSIALASCTATSKEARFTVTQRGEVESELHNSCRYIVKQALTSNSSRSRVSQGFEQMNNFAALNLCLTSISY